MALINCSECGKEISDKAQICPNCGNPQNVKSEEYICCPKCHSKELHSEQKGFSGGKALAGAVLTGGIGLLAGTIGSKDVNITCLKCGNKFKAGEALILQSGGYNLPLEIDKDIVELLNNGNRLAAVKVYKDKSGLGLVESKQYIDSICAKHNINTTSNAGGCTSVIVLLIILVTSIVFAIM